MTKRAQHVWHDCVQVLRSNEVRTALSLISLFVLMLPVIWLGVALADYLEQLMGTYDARLLAFSPFLVIAMPLVITIWQRAPRWIRNSIRERNRQAHRRKTGKPHHQVVLRRKGNLGRLGWLLLFPVMLIVGDWVVDIVFAVEQLTGSTELSTIVLVALVAVAGRGIVYLRQLLSRREPTPTVSTAVKKHSRPG